MKRIELMDVLAVLAILLSIGSGILLLHCRYPIHH